MNVPVLRRRVLQLIGILFIPAKAVASGLSNKWRIQCSGGADSDGQIVFLITPEDEDAIEIAVDIPDGTGENRVAKIIVKTMKAHLDKHNFHIERDDGEDVLVKKRHGAHRFALEIVSNTVDGVRLNPDKE